MHLQCHRNVSIPENVIIYITDVEIFLNDYEDNRLIIIVSVQGVNVLQLNYKRPGTVTLKDVS